MLLLLLLVHRMVLLHRPRQRLWVRHLVHVLLVGRALLLLL